jgi:hypothetical protein
MSSPYQARVDTAPKEQEFSLRIGFSTEFVFVRPVLSEIVQVWTIPAKQVFDDLELQDASYRGS